MGMGMGVMGSMGGMGMGMGTGTGTGTGDTAYGHSMHLGMGHTLLDDESEVLYTI